jgi:hypothetical protein
MTFESDNDNAAAYFMAHRFSWSAAFAGAFVATAVTFFVMSLGAGFGLVLTNAKSAATPAFLSLGAIYFLAAQAFGFAAGGHIAGRLIGPAPETAKEEEFRSAAHGLVVWALAVVATATLVALGSLVAGSSMALTNAASVPTTAQNATFPQSYVTYWVDMLFRPGANPSQAALEWRQYAQADNGTANDASQNDNNSTQTQTQMTPAEQAPASGAPQQIAPTTPDTTQTTPLSPPLSPAPAPTGTVVMNPSIHEQQIAPIPPTFTPPPSLSADKAEATTIIDEGMKDDARLSQYDKERLSVLVAQDTGLTAPEAQRRVDNAEQRIHDHQTQLADNARKTASFASLWIATSLLFGAIVAMMAAASARWEDDRITFGWPKRDPK